MSQLTSLIAQGKPAVEGELTRLEQAFSDAKATYDAGKAAIAADLSQHINDHQAEVTAAQALLARAQTAAAAPATPAVPALSLTQSTGVLGKVFAAVWNHWPWFVFAGSVLVVIDFAHKMGKL